MIFTAILDDDSACLPPPGHLRVKETPPRSQLEPCLNRDANMITGFADDMFSSVCAPFLFVSICSCRRFLLQCIGVFCISLPVLSYHVSLPTFCVHAFFFFHGQILQFFSFFMSFALFLVAFSPLSLFYWLCRALGPKNGERMSGR